MRQANEYERADHYRDLRKHEPRPTDPLPLHVQSAPVVGALEVAILAKAVSVAAAAALIEQYAQTMAAGARLDGVAQAYRRIDDALTGVSNAQA